LYVQESPQEVRFCSEARELLRSGVELDKESLHEYLRWGCLPVGRSLWRGIRMVKPGHWIRVGRDLEMEEQRYWPNEPIVSADQASSRGSAKDVRRWVEAAVERHLLADVPVAAFLSGGIDSSIVTLVAGRLLGRRLSTFNVGFANHKVDESIVAAQVASKVGARHHSLLLNNNEALEMVPKAVAAMDSPSIDAVNTFLVASQVHLAGIKVALSGLGADELFGGYPSFRDVRTLKRLAGVPRWAWQMLAPFWGKAGRLMDLPSAHTAVLARWRRSHLSAQEESLAEMPTWKWRREWAPELPDSFAEISWQELFGYTSPMLLRDSDQMSMAVSLEIRVPFLDHELVSRILALPESLKKGLPPKRLLIDAFQDDLPNEVWNRPKQGFELPMDSWMRGPLREFVSDGLIRLNERHVIGERLVEKRRADFETRKSHWTRLWALVVLGHYLHNNRRVDSSSTT
jgi:asparagine synthase (glutamine-hydrolysing)